MQQSIVKNPVLQELDFLIQEFEEIQTVAAMAKFCILNIKPFIKEKVKHYTVVPIKINKDKMTVQVGDIFQTNEHKSFLSVASKCDLVALVPNGPLEFSEKYLNTIVARTLNTDYLSRYISDSDGFHSLGDVMAYLGIAVIKHSYFWMSHEYCNSTHEYYKRLSQHPEMFINLYNKNIFDYSMSHECVFGYNGNALMRIFDMSSEHLEHFISMIYSQCNAFDEHFRSRITRLSTKYEQNPFAMQMLGDQVVITKLHTHEHYQYLQYKNLINDYKLGKVKIDMQSQND